MRIYKAETRFCTEYMLDKKSSSFISYNEIEVDYTLAELEKLIYESNNVQQVLKYLYEKGEKQMAKYTTNLIFRRLKEGAK